MLSVCMICLIVAMTIIAVTSIVTEVIVYNRSTLYDMEMNKKTDEELLEELRELRDIIEKRGL